MLWTRREYLSTATPRSPRAEDDLNAFGVRFGPEPGTRTRLVFLTGFDSRDVSEEGEEDFDEYWARIRVVWTIGEQDTESAHLRCFDPRR